MSLSYTEILDSGLLELYVLDKLIADEAQIVEQAIIDFPQLKQELNVIENALYKYDVLFNTKAPAGVLNQIISQIDSKSAENTSKPITKQKSWWPSIAGILSFLLLGSLILLYLQNRQTASLLNEKEQIIKDCETTKKQYERNQNFYAAVTNENAERFPISATEKFPQTNIVIYSNSELKKNYLQIINLPELADNQSFQLWSLKGDDAPIPLNVFESEIDQFLEVDFIDDTNAYAITIEPLGGQDTPTLENLIGVFSIIG